MTHPATILERIVAHKYQEIKERSASVTLSTLEMRLANAPKTRDFSERLIVKAATKKSGVICEIKRASPSKGLLRPNFNPREHAIQYEAAGATCLSVLTDHDFFGGSDQDMVEARRNCSLPVLRKDFVVDAYQILESRVLGADCVLLIVAILNDKQLHSLFRLANDIGLDVLIEVHNERELERALKLDGRLVGINNRNLHTFETLLETTITLAAQIPSGWLGITESGIRHATDVELLKSSGVYSFLVGEAFMRHPNPGVAVGELFKDL